MSPRPTLAQVLVHALADRGVRRIFGVPGGGSSLDVIEAAAGCGIDFVLTQTETAAALMAAVTAELSGAPGVVVTAIGPGAASAVNGIAYAALERTPLVLICDCHDDRPGFRPLHQRFDHGALYAPLVKASRALTAGGGRAAIEALLDAAMAPPRGPVQIDLSAGQAAAPAADSAASPRACAAPRGPAEAEVARARALLAGCTRPVIVAGLFAREAAEALRVLAAGLGAPVLVTYKAKGVMPDSDPLWAGLFTGAAAEAETLGRADLILLVGLDPVEAIPQPWRFAAPLVELSPVAGLAQPARPAARLIGSLAASAAALAGAANRIAWTEAEIAGHRQRFLARLAMAPGPGRNAHALVQAVRRAVPPGTRVAVDSGAHMFSAMAFWPAEAPLEVLKSNGLSTMAYALPAAIAAALHDPARPVVALTGDGGLMMGLGELATAARLGLAITVVVFNDAALSLIDIKQQRQGRPSRGVRYPAVDLAATARALGLRAWRVAADEALEPVVAEALAGRPGPALIDVAVDAGAYLAQIEALRG